MSFSMTDFAENGRWSQGVARGSSQGSLSMSEMTGARGLRHLHSWPFRDVS